VYIGQRLLKEFVFKFTTYLIEDVRNKDLKTLICREYFLIIKSLSQAS